MPLALIAHAVFHVSLFVRNPWQALSRCAFWNFLELISDWSKGQFEAVVSKTLETRKGIAIKTRRPNGTGIRCLNGAVLSRWSNPLTKHMFKHGAQLSDSHRH